GSIVTGRRKSPMKKAPTGITEGCGSPSSGVEPSQAGKGGGICLGGTPCVALKPRCHRGQGVKPGYAPALHRVVPCRSDHRKPDRSGQPAEHFAAGGQQGPGASRTATWLCLVQLGARTPVADRAGTA